MRLVLAAQVAVQALFRVLFGIPFKGKNELVRRGRLGLVTLRGFLCVRVSLSRAVTHLAAGHRILLRGHQRRMPRFRKHQRFGAVAGLAPLHPNVTSRRPRPDMSDRNPRRLTRGRARLGNCESGCAKRDHCVKDLQASPHTQSVNARWQPSLSYRIRDNFANSTGRNHPISLFLSPVKRLSCCVLWRRLIPSPVRFLGFAGGPHRPGGLCLVLLMHALAQTACPGLCHDFTTEAIARMTLAMINSLP